MIAESFIRTAIVLHNFLRIEDEKEGLQNENIAYAPTTYLDCEVDGRVRGGLWRTDVAGSTGMVPVAHLAGNRSSILARQQQSLLADFFVSLEGAVPWQSNMV